MPSQAEVVFAMKCGTLYASVNGEIDHHSAKFLKEQIDEELCNRRPDKLSLDFSGVTFMDSSGLGLLAGRKKTAADIGCAFELLNPSERIMKMLGISGAEKIFSIV